MARRKRLGEILVDVGLITETQLSAALSSQRTWGGRVGSTLVRMGFVKEADILKCLSAQLRLPSVDFHQVRVSPRAVGAVPLRIAERYTVMPVALKEEKGKKSVVLAMADPTNLDAVNEIQFQAGVTVRPVVATESAIVGAIDRYYRKKGEGKVSMCPAKIDLAEVDGGEEMVILSKGEETRVASLDTTDARELVTTLIRLLEQKGVIEPGEILRALHS